jgi:hypothetical protein
LSGGGGGGGCLIKDGREEEEEEEAFINHNKNDLKRNAHTLSGDTEEEGGGECST